MLLRHPTKNRLLFGLILLAAVGAPLSVLDFAPPCQCARASSTPDEASCPACATDCCTPTATGPQCGVQAGCDNCGDDCGCPCCEAVTPPDLYVASRVPASPDDQLQLLFALPATVNSIPSSSPSFATRGWPGNLDTRLASQSLPELCRWLN